MMKMRKDEAKVFPACAHLSYPCGEEYGDDNELLIEEEGTYAMHHSSNSLHCGDGLSAAPLACCPSQIPAV